MTRRIILIVGIAVAACGHKPTEPDRACVVVRVNVPLTNAKGDTVAWVPTSARICTEGR